MGCILAIIGVLAGAAGFFFLSVGNNTGNTAAVIGGVAGMVVGGILFVGGIMFDVLIRGDVAAKWKSDTEQEAEAEEEEEDKEGR